MSFQEIIQTQLTAKQREKLGLLLGESPEKSQKTHSHRTDDLDLGAG